MATDIDWRELDKRKYYVFGPTLFMGVRIVIYPATLIKTYLQLQRADGEYKGVYDAFSKIIRNEGFRGLYRGFLPNALTVFAGQIYITIYEFSRSEVKTKLSQYESVPQYMEDPIRNFVAASLASVFSQFIVVPLDIVSQYLMIQGRKGFVDHSNPYNYTHRVGIMRVARDIAQFEGIRGFYKGYMASILTYAPSSAIWWSSYGVYRDWMINLSPVLWMGPPIAGAMAGLTASILTNPMDVLRTRLQVMVFVYKKMREKINLTVLKKNQYQ